VSGDDRQDHPVDSRKMDARRFKPDENIRKNRIDRNILNQKHIKSPRRRNEASGRLALSVMF
jgi:hypothetical protein